MKKICILSCCIAIVIAIELPDCFAFAAERNHDYKFVIDKVADKYIGKTVPGACVIISEHGENKLKKIVKRIKKSIDKKIKKIKSS